MFVVFYYFPSHIDDIDNVLCFTNTLILKNKNLQS